MYDVCVLCVGVWVYDVCGCMVCVVCRCVGVIYV